MKKVLLWIVGGLAVLTAILFVISFFLPTQYHVERSIVIHAAPTEIYPHVNNLKGWQSWSAWTKEKYPEMEYSYTGPEEGIGATSMWKDKDGAGKMTITKSNPEKGVWYDLTFVDWKTTSHGGVEFNSSQPNQTEVRWVDEGELPHNPVCKYFGLFFNSMIGKDFETGLGNLKKLVESKA